MCFFRASSSSLAFISLCLLVSKLLLRVYPIEPKPFCPPLKNGLSSNKPLLSSSSTASSISSTSFTIFSKNVPRSPTAGSKMPRNKKNLNTSTSGLSWPVPLSYNILLPTWLCHMLLKPNAAIGNDNAIPLYFPFPKFFAQVVTALKYMATVAIPIHTNAKTIHPIGHPLLCVYPVTSSAPLR